MTLEEARGCITEIKDRSVLAVQGTDRGYAEWRRPRHRDLVNVSKR